MKRAPAIISAVALVGAAAVAAVVIIRPSPPRLPASLAEPRPLPPGGDFRLDAAAGPFALADQRGRAVVLAFGYTACPDVCPTTLATVAAALRMLTPAEAAAVTPVFVSVDPQRDTPATLAGYVRFFDPRIHGVTGSPADVAAVAAQYQVEYAQVFTGDDGGYAVDHSAEVHVLDRAGRPRARLPYDAGPEALSAALRDALGAPVPPVRPSPGPPEATVAASALAPAGPADAAISVVDPYVRAVPPGSVTTAAFMRLHNAGSTPRAVVTATSPAARVVELHQHIDDGGVMRMRQVARIDVPGGGDATLAPGGYHVMLIDLRRPLAVGDLIPIELGLDDGSRVRVDAPVRAIAPAGGHDHHGM